MSKENGIPVQGVKRLEKQKSNFKLEFPLI